MMKWTDEHRAELRRLWALHPGQTTKVARLMGLTRGQVLGAVMRLNLPPGNNRWRVVLEPHDPILQEGRTLYPRRVKPPGATDHLLKSGRDNRKIGDVVRKGRWRGMPIYTLTLEERATCPQTCAHWRDCYGNNMQLARRWEHGEVLEDKLDEELRRLAIRHRRGFVVRLHVLGDFYSIDYINMWMYWLETIPQLRIWGYTAHRPSSAEGTAIASIAKLHWDRFALRHSNAGLASRGTTTLYPAGDLFKPRGRIAEGIVCPVETGDARSCADCALCWQTTDNIVFLAH